MALAPEPRIGVQLRDRNMQAGEAVGIERSLDVALERPDANALRRVGGDPLEQRCLPGTGRAHQVHDRHLMAVEVFAVGASNRVVGVECVLDNSHLGPVHEAPCSRARSSKGQGRCYIVSIFR